MSVIYIATGLIPSRSKRLFRWLLRWRRLSPPTLFLASFIVLIGICTAGLLVLPGLYTAEGLDPLDALFTATSAVCVTGLIVVDTATHFTFWGQLWILVFIQLGGLGLITLTTMIIGALGQRLSLRSEILSGALPHHTQRAEVWELAAGVARFTLAVEAIGAWLLFLLWLPRFGFTEALWHAVFHSISAYCNAGFSTFSDSLVGLDGSPLTILVISALVILGGVGYLASAELHRWWQGRHQRASRRLSTHTYAVVVTTISLLALGWVLFAFFEWDGVLAEMSIPDKLANALFMSVTPRTAGFNTIDYAQVGNDSAVLTMIFMVIGGSPGSTAGGIKTTTIAVMVALGLSRSRGRRFVELHLRAVPEGTIERAVSIVLLYTVVLVTAFFLLNSIQSFGLSSTESQAQFLPIVFEAVSAFSTVGLSMGETAALNKLGLIVVIVLMFIGRVGLLSFFAAVALRRGTPPAYLRPAQEDVMVG
jgi:trk system potassium uptake protein